MGMTSRSLYRIPRANALIAFECAARHRNFTPAANELGTSQSAVSRHIGQFETWLSVRLFERFRDGVFAGLAAIHRGAVEATELSNSGQLVIGCSHEAAHSFIMLRYGALHQALGEDVRIRILTYYNHIKNLPADPAADILLTWDASAAAPEDRVVAFKEAVRPVCSPAYAAEHERILAGPVAGWSELTLLDLLPNQGWATWEDWFAVAGQPVGAPRRLGLDSYIYVLEAAAAGQGVALGWRRYIERFLEAGTLVALGEGFVESDRGLYAALTGKGRRKPLARRCLACFELD